MSLFFSMLYLLYSIKSAKAFLRDQETASQSPGKHRDCTPSLHGTLPNFGSKETITQHVVHSCNLLHSVEFNMSISLFITLEFFFR